MNYYCLRDNEGAVTLKGSAVARWGIPAIADDLMLVMDNPTAQVMASSGGRSVRIERMPAADRAELETVMRGRGIRFWAWVEQSDERQTQFSFFDLNGTAGPLCDGQHRHPRSSLN